MPRTGLEPVPPFSGDRILSPACLPIPPPRLRAADGTRTRDLNLGKVALYQLSYSRFEGGHYRALRIYVKQ